MGGAIRRLSRHGRERGGSPRIVVVELMADRGAGEKLAEEAAGPPKKSKERRIRATPRWVAAPGATFPDLPYLLSHWLLRTVALSRMPGPDSVPISAWLLSAWGTRADRSA